MVECNKCGCRLRKSQAHEDPHYPELIEEYTCTDCYRGALEELIDELQNKIDQLPAPKAKK